MNPFNGNLEFEDNGLLETQMVDLEKDSNDKVQVDASNLLEEKQKKIKYYTKLIVIFCLLFVIVGILLLFFLSGSPATKSNKTEVIS